MEVRVALASLAWPMGRVEPQLPAGAKYENDRLHELWVRTPTRYSPASCAVSSGAVAPERSTPGVFVEEVSSRRRPIEGLATGIGAFIGTAASGPIGSAESVTGQTEFETKFGGLTTDMLHPSDLGMIQMGEHLAARLRPILDQHGV